MTDALANHGASPSTRAAAILVGLYDLYLECNCRNWDGYDADPVTEENINIAKDLAMAVIEAGLPMPEFGADPDGEVMLDWYGPNRPNRSVISMSIGPSGQIAWASALPDGSRVRGSTTFKGKLDDTIKQAIQDIAAQRPCLAFSGGEPEESKHQKSSPD